MAVALAVLIVGAVHSLVDFSLEIEADMLLYLALIAIGVAAALDRTDLARPVAEAEAEAG